MNYILILLLILLFTPCLAQNQKSLVGCVIALDKHCQVYVCENPDQLPVYPGGMSKMGVFLQKNIHIRSGNNEFQTKVIVQFIVSETGKLLCLGVPKKDKGEYTKTETEVLRVVGLMPDWKPGQYNRKKVSTRYTLPISCLMYSTQ